MKKAAVLGATGGMGSALVEELAGRGIETVAFARSEQSLQRLRDRISANQQIRLHAGDASRMNDIMEAIRGCDTVFHSINLPYQDWHTGLLPLTRRILDAVKEEGSRLVVIDNIYSYGRGSGIPLEERHPKQPHTVKGKLRQQMDEMIMHAAEKSVSCLIAHFPDFYGPHAGNTILNYTLQAMVNGKRPGYIGPLDFAREYIYMPDAARACIELALRPDTFGQEWNIPGAGVIAGREVVEIAADVLSQPVPRVFTVGRGMLRLMGLFNPLMREMVEMMYLREENVVLSGAKYETHIGPLPATPYRDGIRETVRSLRLQSGRN